MLEDIIREVAESRSVTEGTVAFVNGLKAKIEELSKSGLENTALKEQLAALAAELDAQQKTLAEATVVGTNVETQPAPVAVIGAEAEKIANS